MKPIEVKNVYDNNGDTIDRYSIYIESKDGENNLICCCSNPSSPYGVFSRAYSHQFDLGEHLGKEIEWEDLPSSVQNVIINELT